MKPSNCGVASHSKKIDWDESTFYLKENETRAFSKPVFKCETLDPSEIEAILEVALSVKEFTTLFDHLNQGTKPERLSAVSRKISVEVLEKALASASLVLEDLVSPKFATKDRCFVDLKTKWTQTSLEVEASHALAVKDLALLHNLAVQFKEIVSLLDPLVPQTLPLTSGMRELSDEVKNLMFSQSETQDSVKLVLIGQQDFRQTIIESIEENETKISVATHDFQV